MKKFLAIYIGSDSSPQAKQWELLDEATRTQREQAGTTAWMNWVQNHGNSIADIGSPIGTTKQVDSHGITATKNAITAYTVVQAESHEAAAKMFLNHPHFTIFPGDSIEIMECLPIPGM